MADLDDLDADDLSVTLKFMVKRRQICVRDGHVALFWHRHAIPPIPIVPAAPLRLIA